MDKLDQTALHARLAAHPIRKAPYDKLSFVRIDGNGVALYAVVRRDGSVLTPQGAKNALEAAAREWGVHCFYHGANCPDNPNQHLVSKRQRDHVLAVSRDGSDELHNLVLCCEHANSRKGAQPVCNFDQAKAQQYLELLSRHISDALRTPVGIPT